MNSNVKDKGLLFDCIPFVFSLLQLVFQVRKINIRWFTVLGRWISFFFSFTQKLSISSLVVSLSLALSLMHRYTHTERFRIIRLIII